MTLLNLARSLARRQRLERLKVLASERRVLIETFPELAHRTRTQNPRDPNRNGAARSPSSSGAVRRSSPAIPTGSGSVN